MKRVSKGILSVLLVVCVALSVCAFTGVFSSAQAIPEGVNAAFTNADNDWVTLSGTRIQDSALKFTVYNNSEDTIVLTKLEHNGITIDYTDWTINTRLGPSGIKNIGISGTTTNNAVLKVTVTYYVEGNPTATAETCSAYIYCSSSQGYTSVTNACGVESGFLRWGVDTTEIFSPVSTGSVEQTGEFTRFPVMTISLYVDTSLYKTWESLNAKINFKNGTIRDHAYWDKIELSQSSSTGSVSVLSSEYTVNGTTKSITSEFNSSQDNPSGFFVQVGENAATDIPISGNIAQEASSTVKIKFRGYGQTGGFFGLGPTAVKTRSLEPTWNITLYNNNKSELRDRLNELARLGLNQASYKSGWDAYETALKNAYTTLGTNKVTASQVSSAVTSLNNAYKALVRYAVVITNHHYYTGNDDQNPVQIAKKFEMQVTNGASHSMEVLTNGTYPDYPFNRTSVTTDKMIQVGEDTNFTEVVDQYYWYVDTSALEAAIATQAAKVHVDTDNNPIYTDDSWQAYEAEAAKAVTVLNDKSLFQADIDAETKALNDAEKALVKLDIDIEWLTEGIAWADQIINSSYDDDFGYGWQTEELFASEHAQTLYAALKKAYNEAVEVTNDPDYTKAQADRVCASLWQAINNLRTVDETTKGLLKVDGVRHADMDQYGYYKGLQDKLIEPNGLRVVYNDILDNTSGAYRLNEADFTEESWAMLQDALYGDFAQGSYFCAMTMEPYAVDSAAGELSVPAYSMMNNIWFLASQADYNACRDNLIDKVNNLEWIVEYGDLEAKLDEASAYELSEYTAKTGGALQAAMDTASAALDKLADPQLYGDPDAVTNEVVAQLVQELDVKIAALELRPRLTPASEEIAFDEGEDTVIYGETIGQTVEQALANLNIVNDSESVVIKIYDGNGVEQALNSKVGTNYKVVLASDEGEVYETHTYVIKGDVIGDAQITDNDFALVYDYAFNEDSLEGLYLDAADVNGDGLVDLTDAILIQNIIYA